MPVARCSSAAASWWKTPPSCSTVAASWSRADRPRMSGITVGDFEIIHISGAHYRWDGGVYFGVVPKTMWSRKAPADDLNRIEVAFNCYLIRTDDHSVLIETGAGDKLDARARERMDLPPEHLPLPEILSRQGIDPESIDIVINSHLHFDHCGGNTTLTATGPLAA